MKLHSCSWRAISLLLIVTIIWFGTLDYRKLVKPDEGRYAEIAREMAVTGDWVTPRLNALKYFEKPPLQYWATATAYTLFGEHQWTARLWSALTGFAGLFWIGFVGIRLFGREAGQYAALLLLGSMLYSMIGHINTLDMGLTFFLTVGISSLLLGQQVSAAPHTRRNWMWLAWIALGLAVLSKGLIGLVLPGAALVVYAVLQRDWGLWKRLHLVTGLLLFLLVTVPWFILVMKANPEFFQRFFIYEHYTRFTTKELGRYEPWYYFIPIVLAGILPWTLLMFDTVLRTWKGSGDGKKFNAARFLLIWIAFVYLFFSVSGSKLPSYVLPIFPALALLMGKQLAEMNTRRIFWLTAPMIAVALVLFGLAPYMARLADTPLKQEMHGNYANWIMVAALIWLLGIVTTLVMLRRDRKSTAIWVLALSSFLAAQIMLCGHNTVARGRSSYHIAEAIRAYVTPDIPFYSVAGYEQTLPFYLKRTFTLVAYQDEMGFGIKQEPARWIPDIASFAQVWRDQPAALAIMPQDIYPQLQQQGLPMKIIFADTQYIVVSKP
ncbi:MAG: glycosyltransferase family 39 protein [Gallionellaceae bacterium]|nr:glycosyltransferase family 39 protein [Gallionellaceae bacterium]